jgi:hypothetical protein
MYTPSLTLPRKRGREYCPKQEREGKLSVASGGGKQRASHALVSRSVWRR